MKAFICHSSKDSEFVVEVAKLLKRNIDVYYYEDCQTADGSFWPRIDRELNECEALVTFVGEIFSENQEKEVKRGYDIHKSKAQDKAKEENGDRNGEGLVFCLLDGASFPEALLTAETVDLKGYPIIEAQTGGFAKAKDLAEGIMRMLGKRLNIDGLPSNPHLFPYEKDIINHFVQVGRLRKKRKLSEVGNEVSEEDAERVAEIRSRQLEGCPVAWPEVVRWDGREIDRIEWQSKVGRFRKEDAKVIVATLTDYHNRNGDECEECCLRSAEMEMTFPEAGPRKFLHFPRNGKRLKVAILVSGGIAPGTNAVIDGIVQRHIQYANEFDYSSGLSIDGITNGFLAFDQWGDNKARQDLKQSAPNISYRASEGGSLLGTSRVDELLADSDERWDKLDSIVAKLYHSQVDILYIIGGDGSMKAAHALWTVAQKYAEDNSRSQKLSVIAIPKTMDNDILWVWQTFGFLSAVEKAREIIDHLATEVASNPRLCVAQLFGSDSGFVVSHAVLASRPGQCDVALIPEIDFSIEKVAQHLREKMRERQKLIQHGLVVMAETAIPEDAMRFVDKEHKDKEGRKDYIEIGLTEKEKLEIEKFVHLRNQDARRPGQTSDHLRSAGLKIVSQGLKKLLNVGAVVGSEPKLRVVTNEPRHLLRALPPSCTDIIMGNRLGTLAVDNALAGYTDFMVSQWLTEYVLVPLELVVLGRKRIPGTGIFWKSVIAKTGQPADLA